jgi:Flp pilus assembly protein TadD
MRSGSWPHSARPLRQVSAVLRGEAASGQALARASRRRPRAEILRGELREGEQQVAEVALGVDGDRRDAVDRGLLEQREAQAGLAAAGHADADRVRGDLRKAVLALRERAALVDDGASWVMLGVMLRRVGRRDEAHAALRTGIYHHRRAGAHGRARTTTRILETAHD